MPSSALPIFGIMYPWCDAGSACQEVLPLASTSIPAAALRTLCSFGNQYFSVDLNGPMETLPHVVYKYATGLSAAVALADRV